MLSKLPKLGKQLRRNNAPKYDVRELPVTVPSGRARHRIVVVSLVNMGLSTAAAATEAAINKMRHLSDWLCLLAKQVLFTAELHAPAR